MSRDAVTAQHPSSSVILTWWDRLCPRRTYPSAARHIGVFRDRAQWFEKMDKPNYCLWWVPAGHIPTVAEARERLEHYQLHGATPFSFWFSQPYPAPSAEPPVIK